MTERRRILGHYSSLTDTATGNGRIEFPSARSCNTKSSVFYGDCIQADIPSPESPQPIIVSDSIWAVNGTNLWDFTGNATKINNVESGYTFIDNIFVGKGVYGSRLAYSSGAFRYSTATVLPQGRYIISVDVMLLEVGQYDSQIRIYGIDNSYEAIGTGITYFLVKDKYIRLYQEINATNGFGGFLVYLNNNKLQINAGSFKVYSDNTQRIDLSGIKLYGIDDVRDEFDSATGKLTRRIGVTTYRGSASEDWGMEVLSGKNNFYIEEPLATGKFSDKILCSHGRWVTSSLSVAGDCKMTRYFNYLRPDISSVDEFKNWLNTEHQNGSDFQVYYPLKTPTVTYTTPQPISQIAGNNTLQQISGNIHNTRADITYYSYGTHNINN